MYQLEQQCDNRARAAHDLEAHTVNQPSSSILKRLHPKTTAAKTAACLLAGCALLAPLTAQAKPASLDDKLAATVEQYEQKPNEKKLAAIRDLLAKDQEKRLALRSKPDTGVYVQDLSSFVVKNEQEMDQVGDGATPSPLPHTQTSPCH